MTAPRFAKLHKTAKRLGSLLTRPARLFTDVRRRVPAATLEEGELAYFVNFVHEHCLGRKADGGEVKEWKRTLSEDIPLSHLLRKLETSQEAVECAKVAESNAECFLRLLYWNCFARQPDPEGFQNYKTALRNGMPFSRVLQEFENSVEAEQRRRALTALDELTDGEFILAVLILVQDALLRPSDIEDYRRFLREDRTNRHLLVERLIEANVPAQIRPQTSVPEIESYWVMGTKRHLTRAAWQNRAAELGFKRSERATIPQNKSRRHHTGTYLISAIASMYKARRHLDTFLQNIISQTFFDQCELIIVDADSPGGEQEIITEYQKSHPNIIYKRLDYRVNVYTAWNIAIKLARGKYLTTTNFDDLRRSDSFELQAETLNRHGFADIVYQDFFYNVDETLNFEEIAQFDFKSELPIITADSLLRFNSPHNAPMWRKSIHQDLGLFDASMQSAGDWEFWLRCLWKGKQFLKINTPHVAYFVNPEGISTRPDARRLKEEKQISQQYGQRLISPCLLMSRQSFAKIVGGLPNWDANLSYYEVVQSRLNLLASEKGHFTGAKISNRVL